MFTASAAVKIAEAVRRMPVPLAGVPGAGPGPLEALWAKLTGYSGGVYQWTMQTGDATAGLSDRAPTVSGGYAHDANGSTGALVGQKVRIYPVVRAGSKNLHWVFGVAGGGGLIAVSLTADGGGNGDTTHAPNYTYKWPVNLATGGEILKADGSRATGLSPVWARNIGEFNQATHGTLYMGSDGNPVLYQVDETEQVCT